MILIDCPCFKESYYRKQIFFRNLFFFWLCWVLAAVNRLSLVVVSESYSSLHRMGSHCGGFSCGARSQQLWLKGLVDPQHVESSWTRNGTHVPCTGRWILIHYVTREVPESFLKQIALFTFM